MTMDERARRGKLHVDPTLEEISDHLFSLGIASLRRANRFVFYSDPYAPHWPSLGVLSAAHAAEMFIKARIAQEHPLLIVSKFPKQPKVARPISFRDLFDSAETIKYAELPDRLWATTGVSVPDPAAFHAFGRLRNSVQHFAPSLAGTTQEEVHRFVFGTIDPFINGEWDECAIDHCDDENGDHYEHIVDLLFRGKYKFNMSKSAASRWRSYDWKSDVSTEQIDSSYELWFEQELMRLSPT